MNWLLKKFDFFTVSDSPTSSCSVTSKKSISHETIMRNEKIISELTSEDLNDLENDLEYYEKVSLVLLLYGIDSPQYGLERLIVCSQNPSISTQFLSEWQLRNENKWQETILEALCIANINHVIHKLGLDLEDLEERYLPHNIETNLNIHPILKGLYILCELLTPETSEELIEYMNTEFSTSNSIHTSQFLELHLLDWIGHKFIKLGEWNRNSNIQLKKELCDISSIITFLKSKEMDNIKDKLQNMTIRFNFTKNNLIGRDKEINKKCDKSVKYDKNQSTTIKKKNYTDDSNENANNIDKYKITKSNAGYILIINQKHFFKGPNSNPNEYDLKTRLGTERDQKELLKTFKPFGFEEIIKEDLLNEDIIDTIKDTVKKSKSKDALIVCILSHGRKGTVFASDSVEIPVEEIKRIIASKELLGKPKLLIIQACQNESIEENSNYLEHDGVPEERYDMITAWSTVPGHVSYRHIEEGSWFIQEICSVVQKLGRSQHMLDIVTEVNQILLKKKGAQNEAMTPIWEINLTKKFYLPLE